ncbi:LytR/AlgR family response regulator transcription factor [Lutibacter maritimus]|uniref:Two component transcriptional regulator, LytTR family n=1 Tax=Lutibacter maritimus TaxID=593133 RepID=A0A1I6NQM0_9FLAO|nr:LytTR family DNA-binding domain-containing protein [Lutibacter maritimus]SFS30207.1 two component transcriptional regulator, LytTR family [Lutibacter maritimus]
MNVVIIEDEKPAARRLSRMLNEFGIEPLTMLHSVEEAVNWFSTHEHPDLLFLDIQLSDGLSFEIFDEVEIKSAIIFTTAYDEYALKAFKLNSVDYLLKPIDSDELENAIDQFKKLQASATNTNFDLEQLKLLISPLQKFYKKRFTVKIGQHLKMIAVETIECFYSENKATQIHTIDNRNYLIEDTLDTLENNLNPELFFRVSRKYFVNINAIKDIISYSNSRLKIILNTFTESEIIVSRERVKDFKNWIA